MSVFADIAFPTPVRQLFTYAVPDNLVNDIQPGKRVWLPLRGRMAIGMVIHVHETEPDFECKEITRCLDETPVIDPQLMWLLRWLYRYYFSSLGEAIQAALPSGYNFVSTAFLRPSAKSGSPRDTNAALALTEIREKESYPLDEAEKRWQTPRLIPKLLKGGYLEIWEEPRLSAHTGTEKIWYTSEDFARLAPEVLTSYANKKKPLWVQTLESVSTLEFPVSHQDAIASGLKTAALRRLEQEGLLRAEQTTLKYQPPLITAVTDPHPLNEDQKKAYENIEKSINKRHYSAFLLQGVTGSGKTEIYIHAIRETLRQGRSAIILIPEIALTPQTVRRFSAVFGDNIAVMHSRLSDRERLQAWEGIRNGDLRLVIGARSAVFAPVPNLGMIILDEEHDSSYKQEDPAPRYHTRDVAFMRAHHENAVLVMGSATPSMAALKTTQDGKATLLRLDRRPFSTQMPEVRILDMRQYRGAKKGPLAIPLYNAVAERLEQGEQSLFLYNRRGFSNFVQCARTGEIPQCPSCSVSLTYHRPLQQLRCHYCGYSQSVFAPCSDGLPCEPDFKGSGTQQVEEDISMLFPNARILRLDQDTARKKNGHERILGAFYRGEADILIGTQLIAKGLDFPNLTLAGVIDADTELAFPSFRSGERMFQLLTQLAGRPGRAEKKGLVFLQTMQPDHPAFRWVAQHNFDGFAAEEMENRRVLHYPPYSRFINVTFRAEDQDAVQQAAEIFAAIARDVFPESPVLGPEPSVILRMHGQFRWELQIKVSQQSFKETEKLLATIVATYESAKPRIANTVKYAINVDAIE